MGPSSYLSNLLTKSIRNSGNLDELIHGQRFPPQPCPIKIWCLSICASLFSCSQGQADKNNKKQNSLRQKPNITEPALKRKALWVWQVFIQSANTSLTIFCVPIKEKMLVKQKRSFYLRSSRTHIIRSTSFLGNTILRRGLFLCNSSSPPQLCSETLSGYVFMQSWMSPKPSCSIIYNRNVNCIIDFLLYLYCLFNFIFFAGNFLIKNPVSESPTSQVILVRLKETQALNFSWFYPLPPSPTPARVQDWKLLHLELRVNACDLQVHRG